MVHLTFPLWISLLLGDRIIYCLERCRAAICLHYVLQHVFTPHASKFHAPDHAFRPYVHPGSALLRCFFHARAPRLLRSFFHARLLHFGTAPHATWHQEATSTKTSERTQVYQVL